MCIHTCACGRYVKVCVIVKACDCQEVSRACGSKLSRQMLGEGVSVSSRVRVAAWVWEAGGGGTCYGKTQA